MITQWRGQDGEGGGAQGEAQIVFHLSSTPPLPPPALGLQDEGGDSPPPIVHAVHASIT